MPSPESIKARRALRKETVDPSVSLADERTGWDAVCTELPIAPGVRLEMVEICGVPAAQLTPAGPQDAPLIVYAHGGGLVAGSIPTHRAFASRIAAATGCQVILPAYRLLPEHPLSIPSDDLIAVTRDVVARLEDRKRRVFLGGDSSGAGLAISSMVRLKDEHDILPAGFFAISGAFDATLSGESIRTRDREDPVLSEAVLRHWQSQLGGFDLADPMISPLFADLSGLPPALLLVGEDEVWLDDSVRLHAKLTAANIPSDLRIFDGMWHVWPMTEGLPESEEALSLIAEFIQRHR
ncbi:MAG: alpha/beta hydrolase [Pseudomonadota bacterium]